MICAGTTVLFHVSVARYYKIYIYSKLENLTLALETDKRGLYVELNLN